MEILERLTAPTPPFFKEVRKVGLILTAIGAAVIGIPEQLPEAIDTIAGILAIVGTAISGVAQAAVKRE